MTSILSETSSQIFAGAPLPLRPPSIAKGQSQSRLGDGDYETDSSTFDSEFGLSSVLIFLLFLGFYCLMPSPLVNSEYLVVHSMQPSVSPRMIPLFSLPIPASDSDFVF